MDSGWIKALELPEKITGGVFAACLAIYFLDRSGHVDLSEIGEWARTAIIIVGIFSASLFVASLISTAISVLRVVFKESLERKNKMDKQGEALSHLDKLSEQEIYLVCRALQEGSPSFTSWAYSGGATQLTQKGLLIKHDGKHSTDHWPFTFRDFAWEEIEKRSEFFLEKEKKLEAARQSKRW